MAAWRAAALAAVLVRGALGAAWSERAPLAEWHAAEGRAFAAAALAQGDRALVWGGVLDGMAAHLSHELGDPLVLDSALQWARVTLDDGLRPEPRWMHSVTGPLRVPAENLTHWGVGADGELFVVFGGQLSVSHAPVSEAGASVLGLALDAAAARGRWLQLPLRAQASTPAARVGHAAAAAGGTMFLFGGFRYAPQEGTPAEAYLEDGVWALHWHNDAFEWVRPVVASGGSGAERPSGRHGHALVAFDDLLLLVGGVRYTYSLDTSKQGNVEFLDDVWALRAPSAGALAAADALQWERVSSGAGPSPRAGHAAARRGSDLVVYGGYRIEASDERHVRMLDDVWLLDTDTWAWREIEPVGFLPAGRSDHVALVLGARLVALGGSTLLDTSVGSEALTVVEPQVLELALS